MPRYKSPFDEFRHFQLLAQRWAERDPRLKDYACNLHAPKLAALDDIIDKLEDGPLKQRLQEVRETLKRQGEVMWIIHADIVTNLALKVGKTGTVVSADDVKKVLEELKDGKAGSP